MNSSQTNEEKIFHVLNQMKAAGERDPEITLKEYMKRYAPEESFNNCCILCRQYASCAWSGGKKIPGMVITERKLAGGETTGKIWYCPEFTPDTQKHRYLSDESFVYLLEAIGRQVNQELQNSISRLKYYGETVKKAMTGEISPEIAALHIIYYVKALLDFKSCFEFLSDDLVVQLSRKYDYAPDPEVERYAEDVVLHCFSYIRSKKGKTGTQAKKAKRTERSPLRSDKENPTLDGKGN